MRQPTTTAACLHDADGDAQAAKRTRAPAKQQLRLRHQHHARAAQRDGRQHALARPLAQRQRGRGRHKDGGEEGQHCRVAQRQVLHRPVQAGDGPEPQHAAQQEEQAPAGGWEGKQPAAVRQACRARRRELLQPPTTAGATPHLSLRQGHCARAPCRASMAVDMARRTRLRASTISKTGRPAPPPSFATKLMTAKQAVERTCR